MTRDTRPLVAHVLFRFDTGGLENGVVNLINRMPAHAYRHAVVALTEVTEFRRRLQRDDVACIALHKPPGHGAKLFPRMWRTLRELRPAVVHTRNLAALEMQVPAWAARVPVRVHGEHGRDVSDVDGTNRRLQQVRRIYAPFVHRFVALSQDLQRYLEGPVGIPAERVEQIYNGVDTERFSPPTHGQQALPGAAFDPALHWVVGTVGRLQTIKHQVLLAQAFVRSLELAPDLRGTLRLAIVGDGPLRAPVQEILARAGASELAWLPGERADVADVMRGFSCFALPSLAEGISNTILEAMATGLPVIATNVGGNAELVAEGRTGRLVPSGDVEAMARALVALARAPENAASMGREGRREAVRRFSLDAMVAAYQRLYDDRLAAAGHSQRNT